MSLFTFRLDFDAYLNVSKLLINENLIEVAKVFWILIHKCFLDSHIWHICICTFYSHVYVYLILSFIACDNSDQSRSVLLCIIPVSILRNVTHIDIDSLLSLWFSNLRLIVVCYLFVILRSFRICCSF